jgi:predicted DNA-binding transcriptional regulator AlpA
MDFSKLPETSDDKTLAAFLGLSVITLRKLRQNGRGPRYYKLARRVRYAKRDVIDWVGEPVSSTAESAARPTK